MLDTQPAPSLLTDPHVHAAPRRAAARTAALATGVLVALAVVWLRGTGLLDGYPAVLLAVVVALAVPTSTVLSRRILLLAGFTFGLVPTLWWSNLPLGQVGRATSVLAVLVGSMTTALLWHGFRRAVPRARAALPRLSAVDGILLLAALGGAWVAAAWLRLSSGAAAVAAMLHSWDASAHVDMVLMLRRHGASIVSLGPAAGGMHWKFADYPQGYHGLVATLVELLQGPVAGSAEAEVLAYAHAQGLVVVALAVVLAAAVCALPAARRRPSRALLLSALVAGAGVVGPGGIALRDGFANFTVACALAMCAVLLASSMPYRISRGTVVQVAALAGLLVGVAQSWALMLVVAVPAASLVLLPLRRGTWRWDRRTTVVVAVAAGVALAGMAQTYRALSTLQPAQVLTIEGGITTAAPGVLGATVLTALALTAWPRGMQRSRTRWLAIVPLAGGLAAVGVAVIEHQGGGGLSYYFWKLLTGVALACTAVIATAVARWDGEPRPTTVYGRTRLTAAVALATVACTQVFGFTGTARGIMPAHPDEVAQADALLRAAAMLQDRSGTYLAIDGMNALNAQQWVLALSGQWTTEANDDASMLLGLGGALVPTAQTAARVLAVPGALVVASPQDAQTLRADPALASDTDRILSW